MKGSAFAFGYGGALKGCHIPCAAHNSGGSERRFKRQYRRAMNTLGLLLHTSVVSLLLCPLISSGTLCNYLLDSVSPSSSPPSFFFVHSEVIMVCPIKNGGGVSRDPGGGGWEGGTEGL